MCFVLGLFSLQSPSIAQAVTDPDADAAERDAFGAGPTGFTNSNRSDTGTDAPPSIGERLKFTGYKLDLFNVLSSLGALVAWLGGSLLDATIGVFTVGMYKTSEYFKLDETIRTMWGIIRDIFNLLFIFGLIFAGFKLILGKDDAGSKQMIGSIIVAALLINFSLYAAQVVVDFSNVIAYQINELIRPPETTVVLGGWDVPNISTSFTQLTNLDQLGEQSEEMAEVAGLGVDTLGAAVVLGLLFTVFYSVLGFVFAAGAFVLFSRFIALIFLMIFSPILFLGLIFPNFKSYSSQWLKLLMSQALVGPAFLFMLYLSLQALSGLASIPPSQFTITNLTIYLLIVVAFIWGSLMVARSMSTWGALQAYNAGDRIGKMTSGFVGRNTVGRLSNKWNEGMEKRGVSEKSYARRMAMSLAGSKYGGTTSATEIKASQEKADQKTARYEQLYGKPGIGGRREGGIVQALKKGGVDMEKAVSGASNEQLLELLGKYKPESAEYRNIVASMSSGQYEAAMKAKAEDLDDSAKGTLAKLRRETVEQAVIKAETEKDSGLPEAGRRDKNQLMADSIKGASDAQLRVLGAGEIAKHAAYLKQSQIDSIMKGNDYTETEKDTIRKKRESQLLALFKTSSELPFKGKKDGEIAKLPEKILIDIDAARHLTTGSLKKMLDDDTVTEEVRSEIKKNLLTPVAGVENKVSNDFWETPLGKNF